MDGIHDLGGREGFGAVDRSEHGPLSKRWHGAVFAMLRSLGGTAVSNTDQFRHAVERIDPRAYLTHGYYGRWLGAIETLAVEAGILRTDEITQRANAGGARANDLIAARPGSARRTAKSEPIARTPGAARSHGFPPRFSCGDQVRTSAHGVPGHTRLPAYARGRVGSIRALYGIWVFPDTNAMGLGEQPQHLYSVEFAARELWGADAGSEDLVCLDLFESYLERT